MVISPITGQIELNGQECHMLRKLDEVVERDGMATIDINEVEVTFLKKAEKVFGVCVSKGMTAVDFTASAAFLRLANQFAGVK